MAVLTIGILVVIVSDYLYFVLKYPKCKNCGWNTKKDGNCYGCGGRRSYKWQ